MVSSELTCRGHKVTINFDNENDHIAKQVILSGNFYEIELLDALYDFLEPDDFVVDVGANVGNHSLFFAIIAACRVLAIEPVRRANALLRANIAANAQSEKIFPRQYAAAEGSGLASISSEDPTNLGATRLVVDQTGDIVSRALDSLPEIARNRVSLIKVDVEGMEEAVLQGAVQTIARDQPIVVCECSTQKELAKIESVLEEHGYRTVENFNFTATYLFVPHSWSGNNRLSRAEYLEEAIARTNRTMRTIREETTKARQRMQQLMLRVEKLEGINNDAPTDRSKNPSHLDKNAGDIAERSHHEQG